LSLYTYAAETSMYIFTHLLID